MSKLKLLIQFIPLSVFLTVFRFTNDWPLAFQFGGSIAVLQILWMATMQKRSDLILIGVNAFLIVGAIGFLGGVEPILRMYSQLRETALFIAIFLVALFSHLFLKGSFIDQPQNSHVLVNKSSLLLSIAAALSLLISFFGRGNIWVAGVLPMILILIAKREIKRRIVNSSYTS